MGCDSQTSATLGLLDLWRESGCVEARDRLVAEYLPLVRRVCRKFGYLGEPLEDIVQVGTIGLLRAIHKFDPARGNSLIAFAVPVIVGEIKNYFRDHGWAVKMPRKVQQQKLAVDRAIESLTQTLGRTPTVPEIGQTTRYSEQQVYESFEVERFGRPLSLDAEYERDDSEDTSSILDYLGLPDPELETLAENIDLSFALGFVDPRERAIIYLKFHSGLSQMAIAARLGISQMHVSRLQRNALSKLKSRLLNGTSAD